MSKQPFVTINIPNPCTQDWGAMTPTSSGRHCDSCQKTVIDFTEWTDAALYNFFASNKGHVCGRYLASQVDTPIHIPYQPHSRLYRMVVAMGLTLLFTHTPAPAQQQAPRSAISVAKNGDTSKHNTPGYGEIKGVITDDRKEPLVNASIQVFLNGVLKGGTITDFDGIYSVKPLEAGAYTVRVSYVGFYPQDSTVTVVPASIIDLNIALKRNASTTLLQPVIMGGIGSYHRNPKGITDPLPTEPTTKKKRE